MTALGRLDRVVEFWRLTATNDAVGVVENWASSGTRLASLTALREDERAATGVVEAVETRRFVLHYDALAQSHTVKDRIRFEGRDYEIIGKREYPGRRRGFIEFTAVARAS